MSEPRGASRPIQLDVDEEPLPGYRLVDPLGAGGFGEVWKAEGPGKFHVALKFVRLDRGASVEGRSLEILRHLRHPNLLTPFGSWQVGGFLIIGMELADGSLADRLDRAIKQGDPGIPRDELLDSMAEAARGLDYLNAHRHDLGEGKLVGIQHRDLKPQNILLSGGGVKLADFGLSRLLESSVTGHTGSLTPHYAAPEFFRSATSDYSDQYSLAVTYCHLRCGVLPFRGNHAQLIAGHLNNPPDLSRLPEAERPILERALAKEPDRRWPNCRTFVEELAATKAGPIITHSPTEPESRPPTTVNGEERAVPPERKPSGPTRKLPRTRPPRPQATLRTHLRTARSAALIVVALSALVVVAVVSFGVRNFFRDFKLDTNLDIGADTAGKLDHYNEGVRAFAAGDVDGAIHHFNRAIELDPAFAMAYDGRGVARKKKGELDPAIVDFTEAIRFDPRHASAYNNRGNAYQVKGDLDRAILDYGQAIRVEPKNTSAYSNRANAYLAQGKHDLAILDYGQAIRLDPKYASAYNGRGTAHLAQGLLNAALEDFDHAIRCDSKNPMYYRNRAEVHSRLGRLSKTRADLLKANELESKRK